MEIIDIHPNLIDITLSSDEAETLHRVLRRSLDGLISIEHLARYQYIQTVSALFETAALAATHEGVIRCTSSTSNPV